MVCGLCHNNARTLPNTLSRIEGLSAHFKEAALVVYENDSTDGTFSLLQKHPKIDLVSENLPLFKQFGPVATRKRALHMALCRNKYLDVVKKSYSSYDYMVVTDMDLLDWKVEGVLHSLSYMDKYDSLTANGLDKYQDKVIYYDTWSLVRDMVVQNKRLCEPFSMESAPIGVDSAFGGLAIYKIPSIMSLSYGLWHDSFGVYGSEHTGLHVALKGIGGGQAINPFMVVER